MEKTLKKSVARRHATIKKGSQIQSRGVSRQLTMSKRSSKNATARRLATENQIFYFFSHGVARRLATQHACFFSLPRGGSVNVIRSVYKRKRTHPRLLQKRVLPGFGLRKPHVELLDNMISMSWFPRPDSSDRPSDEGSKF